MKLVNMRASGIMLAALLILGLSSHNAGSPQALAKSAPSSADDANCTLPSDVHPETYSRITVPKREDLQSDEERAAWDRRLKQDPHELDNPDHFQGTSHRLYLPVVG